MKMTTILLILGLSACATQSPELTQAEKDIHVFHEEPKIAYETLGRVDATSRASHPVNALNRVLSRAVELGADGIIVHKILNRGKVAGGADNFGTGGGGGVAVYQVEATAIRYVDQQLQ